MLYLSPVSKGQTSKLKTLLFNPERFYSQINKEKSTELVKSQKPLPVNKYLPESKKLINFNLVGDTKHSPPANKEWTNSVYTYNKNSLKSLSVKDTMTKKLVKCYFNLTVDKTIARSKRMRSLIRKSTAKKLFVSSPEIKQTNDKVIITVYTFDRERQFLLRKLYFNIIKWERLKVKIIKAKRKGRIIKKKITRRKRFGLYDIWRANNKLTFKPSMSMNKPNSAARLKQLVEIITRNSKEKLIEQRKLRVYISKLIERNRTIRGLDRSNRLFPEYKFSKALKRPIAFKRKRIKAKTLRSTRKGLKAIYFCIRRNQKQFKPRKMVYLYKPWLKGTFRLKSFKRYLRKRYLMFNRDRKRTINKKLPYFGFKHYNQMNFFFSRMDNKKKYLGAKKMLLYYYITYLLSLLKIKVLSFEETKKMNIKKLKKLKKEDYEILEIARKGKTVSKKEKNITIKKKVPFYVRRFQQYSLPEKLNKNMQVHFYLKKRCYTITLKNFSLDRLIVFLYSYLRRILNTSGLNTNIAKHFAGYSRRYFLNVFYKSLFYVEDKKKLKLNLIKFNKDALTINSMLKLVINRFKFGRATKGLKLLISKIYSKKAELNIVNLKSPHLNTDIFTEAVAVKLKKRVGLLRVMRRSLQLVKLPYKFKSASERFSVNDLRILNQFRSLDLNNLVNNMSAKSLYNSDYLQAILKALYAYPLVNGPRALKYKQERLFTQIPSNKKENSMSNKITSVLNTIKYKWVTGVRLEAAGRLTRRYTAARSVFKYRYKGSLKNTDYSRKLDFLNNSMPNIILRNLVKSNSQHSFLKSKKRIGAFGLKTWMSSY